MLMEALTDHIDVEHASDGTIVTLVRHVVERPAADVEPTVSVGQPA